MQEINLNNSRFYLILSVAHGRIYYKRSPARRPHDTQSQLCFFHAKPARFLNAHSSVMSNAKIAKYSPCETLVPMAAGSVKNPN